MKEEKKEEEQKKEAEVKAEEKKEEKKEEQPVDELTKFKNEADEYKDKYLRALADLNNIARRGLKEKEDYVKYATSVLIVKILPVLDSFDNALKVEQAKADKGFLSGIKMIHNNLRDVLEKEGLKRQQTAGQKFNPLEHEVVSTVETEESKKDGIIMEEMRSGYTFKDIVIRPAMVKIAKMKEAGEVKESEKK